MERVLYYMAKAIIGFLQWLPLHTVARMGRFVGGLVHLLDARHRRVARNNLRQAFPEKSETEIHAIAKENFKRIAENMACVVKTAGLEGEQIEQILEVKGMEKVQRGPVGSKPKSLIFATGHFGNFELYARCNLYFPGATMATTYRGLKQKSLNDLVQSLRAKSGCLYFDRRTELGKLKEAMQVGGIVLGLLADQAGGTKGLSLPLMGRDCSTGIAPAVFALRYNHPLFTAVCYRVALGKWRIEVGDEIPTHENGVARSIEAIMLDVNRAFDAAIRRDPANWFWVHNRWKRGGVSPKKKPIAEIK